MQLLKIEDVGRLRVQVHEEERFPSPHTGRELRRQVGRTTAAESDNAVILEALKSGPVASVNIEGEETALWQVRVGQYSILNGRCEYSLELTEVEDLYADQVVLGKNGEFELTPYAYREEARAGDGLQIDLRTKLAPDETERLFEFRLEVGRGEEYFPVVRRGINEESRRMRFGWGRWSRHDGAEDKVEVILVEDRVDEADPKVKQGLGDAFADSRARGEIAFSMEHSIALLDLLEQKGVLSKEEREAISKKAHERSYRRYLDFSRVEDLDAAED